MFEVPAPSQRSPSTFEIDRKTQDHNRYGEVKTRLTIDDMGHQAAEWNQQPRNCDPMPLAVPRGNHVALTSKAHDALRASTVRLTLAKKRRRIKPLARRITSQYGVNRSNETRSGQ
jgi:hypothetical protein